jgi:hypothetical protein
MTKLAIISLFRDEAKYLKEWIEFHLLVGVDQFYLLNNLSQDNYQEVLQSYIDNNIVKVVDIPINVLDGTKTFENEKKLVQHVLDKFKEIIPTIQADWICHISCDEFLYPVEQESIKDILNDCSSNIGQMSVNWKLFGHSNYTLEDGDILIEKLTKCDHLYDTHVKSIVRKKAYKNMVSAHYFSIYRNYLSVDAVCNRHNIEKYQAYTKNPVDKNLVINHYVFRDLEWCKTKLARYEALGRGNNKDLMDQYNDDEDLKIQRFLPKLKNRLFISNGNTSNL